MSAFQTGVIFPLLGGQTGVIFPLLKIIKPFQTGVIFPLLGGQTGVIFLLLGGQTGVIFLLLKIFFRIKSGTYTLSLNKNVVVSYI